MAIDLTPTPTIVDRCPAARTSTQSSTEVTAVSDELRRFGGCPTPGYAVVVPVVSVDHLTNAEYIEQIVNGN
jgi:hypothetical protein